MNWLELTISLSVFALLVAWRAWYMWKVWKLARILKTRCLSCGADVSKAQGMSCPRCGNDPRGKRTKPQ
jgi:hypothetical protein